MGYIKLLKGKNLQNHSYTDEEELYPITITDAVFDNNGKNLTTYLNDVNNKLTDLETTLNNTINTFNTTNTNLNSSLINVNSNLDQCINKSNSALSLAISKTLSEQIIIKTNLKEFLQTINQDENYYKLTSYSIPHLQTIWINNENLLYNSNKEVILYISDSLMKALAILYLPAFTNGLKLDDFIRINNWYITSYNLTRI